MFKQHSLVDQSCNRCYLSPGLDTLIISKQMNSSFYGKFSSINCQMFKPLKIRSRKGGKLYIF